jgi:hypothetical protein
MRQVNGVIFEAVQWLRIEPPQLAVVRYEPDGLGLSWRRCNSRKAALAALSEAKCRRRSESVEEMLVCEGAAGSALVGKC